MNQSGESQDLQLLSIEKFAELAGGISYWTVRKWLVAGRIQSVKVGSRRLVPIVELQRICAEGLSAAQ